MGCCCGGRGEGMKNGEPCRDVMFLHQRSKACEELSQFPSSIPLDSSLAYLPSFRNHAEVLVSNQPTWNIINSSSHETDGEKTRVLVPMHGVFLVELFSWKHMEEERSTIEFVMSQCNPPSYESMSLVSGAGDYHDVDGCGYSHPNLHQPEPTADDFPPWVPPPPPPAVDPQNLPWDSSSDQFRLYSSSLNLFDGSIADSLVVSGKPTVENDVSDLTAYQQSLMSGGESSAMTREAAGGSAMDSGAIECSDHGEEEDYQRTTTGRGVKRGAPSKNLHAERSRRKKLNGRLYTLRALVPNISKMDRASILGDAIDYVMELLKQIKDLQDELEENGHPPDHEADDEAAKQNGSNNVSNCQTEVSRPPPLASRKTEHNNLSGEHSGGGDDKGPQMEPHVEVKAVEGNEFFLKVFCEQRPGGFVRLMEAMSSLGLEVTNANVTTSTNLVLNVFRVEKRDNEGVQAEQVRDSLLEVTRDVRAEWPQMVSAGESFAGDHFHHHHHHHRSLRHELHLSAN
ncbi:Transcription factor ABORTED MICROSPORES [Apostasia shenzhenica]|uniref:Transcription factor ABORTED MICROSPORES n=1 Tax=Apostasia shenzhenica TaxID=1088818 RepID=A0A2I0BGA8_9ASPA|nr:Transcription factor ABORTED MICROSPORES [Apostasia shenzhenica]